MVEVVWVREIAKVISRNYRRTKCGIIHAFQNF